MKRDYTEFAARLRKDYLKLLRMLIAIPSPSFQEKRIAEVIRDFLNQEAEKNNYHKVHIYMDSIWNVYCELGEYFQKDTKCNLFCAHIDTVFPDNGTPVSIREENGRLYGMGAKDNCANICALMFCAKYMFEQHIEPEKPLLLVFDVCEEGLGNLKGCKRIFENYSGIQQMIAFDLDYRTVFHKSVGSVRYEVRVKTEGGHAFHDFGKKNAIQIMSDIIQKFYKMDISGMEGVSSYNVGTIEGGTSINSIAQECRALFEWRSDSAKTLGQLADFFEDIVKEEGKNNKEVMIETKQLGFRPSMGVFTEEKKKLQEMLAKQLICVIEAVTGETPVLASASTDCNIPLSMGIPAVCTGTCIGCKEHTEQEYVEMSSLEQGLLLALELVCGYAR